MRLELTGAIFHVTSRGDRRKDNYVFDADREHFIKYWVGMSFKGVTEPLWLRRRAILLELARYIVLNPIRASRLRSAN